MAAEFRRLKELFLRAADLADPAERAAHLRAACGGDHELVCQVEALFREESAAHPLDRPAAGHPPSDPPAPAPAGYQLGERVGEGGMGQVFRAWDTTLGRDVAVKVLYPRAGGDRTGHRRFVLEAGIAARLQHPGVPPVHALGELADGRPYLVMKLIAGRTLADLLRERPDPAHHRGRWVAAFEQVCQAVGYAHARGIIHRDLKPANVMVGEFGEVQVMDWGLARELGGADSAAGGENAGHAEPDDGTHPDFPTPRPELTRRGEVMGTPGYMAPEQARGEAADTRADVFGLGAILCTILTGGPPFAGSDWVTVARANATGELVEVRERLARCGADPELIALCERCLSRDPHARPADGGAVAAAVADWRGRADDRARRAELERAAAEATAAGERQRRRALGWAAAAVFAVLAAGTGVSVWQAVRAAAAEAETAGQLALTLQAEADASAAAADARRAEERATNEAADTRAFSTFLVDHVLAAGRPVGVQNGLGVNVRMTDALRAAEKRVTEVFAGRPRAEAAARQSLGATWRTLSDYPAAERHLTRALELRRLEFGPDSLEAAETMNSLGVLYAELGRFDEAEPLLTESFAARRAALGPTHIDTLTHATSLGHLYLSADRLDDAERELKPTADDARHTLGAGHPVTASARVGLAQLLARRGRLPAAEEELRAVVADCREGIGRRDADTIDASTQLILFYLATGRPHPAARLAEEVVADCRSLFGDRHRLTLSALNNLASALSAQRKFAEADAVLAGVVDGNRAVLGDGHEQTVISQTNRGHAKFGLGERDEAEKLYRAAFLAGRKALGLRHTATRQAGASLGELRVDAGRPAEAVDVLTDALAGYTADDPRRERCQSNLGFAMAGDGRPTEAYPHLKAGQAALAKAGVKVPGERVRMERLLRTLAEVCEATGQADEGARWRAELAAFTAPKPAKGK